ncbi:MAG TPA: winged helix-turn-helix domain-containing protein [Planctomycetota bacterium]|jgi:DNA-binding response OmpR family regulator
MLTDNAHRLDALASQLTETLMTAAICAQEIRTLVRAELDDDAPTDSGRHAFKLAPSLARHKQRPLIDESTLSVIWRGRTLHLGQTLKFRLLERLARRPNQYVTHLDLLQDVWHDEYTETATIRSMVRELRRKLCGGGMTDLAAAIRGHQERYILEL